LTYIRSVPMLKIRHYNQLVYRPTQVIRFAILLLVLTSLTCQPGCKVNQRKSKSFSVKKLFSQTDAEISHNLEFPKLSAQLASNDGSHWGPDKRSPASAKESRDEPMSQKFKIQRASFDDIEEISPSEPSDSINAVAEFRLLDGVASTSGAEWNLNQVIAFCLSNDPALGVGFQEIRQAYAEQVTASLKPNPELEILQSLLPLGRPFDASLGREGGPPQFDVMLSFPIDWYLFGKRAAAMRAAFQGRRATELEFANLVRERVLEVSLAFFDVLEQENLLELAEQDVENLREVERVTQIAVTNGALPVVELNRIKLDRLNSEQTLRETRRDLMGARGALLSVIGGINEPVNFRLLGDLDGIEKENLPPLDELFQLAQNNRPDIIALQTRINEARANMDVEFREQFADVEPVFGYTRQFQERAIDFPDVSSWGVGLRMSLPFHDRNQGNRLRANSEFFQQREEFRLGLVELRAELIEVMADLETSRENAISTGEEQIQLAEEVRDGIRKAYEAGGRPLIDVLDSQRNFRETVRNFINSRADYWRAVQRYNAALAIQAIE